MRVNSKIIKGMDMVGFFSQMADNTRDGFKTTKNVDKAIKSYQMVKVLTETSQMI